MLTAGEAYRKIKAAGGDFILDGNREVVEATGPSDVLDLLEENDVSPENLSAIVREHFTAVSVAEKFLASIRPKAAAKPKAPKKAERMRPATPIVQKEAIDAFEPRKRREVSDESGAMLALRVLENLCSYAGKRWYCTPSLPMMTADLGLPAEQWVKVRAALATLELLGKIKIERRPNTSNRYTILAPLESEEDFMALAREHGPR